MTKILHRRLMLWRNYLPQFFYCSANYVTKKRFYKNTSILFSEGKYEITLDQRKLKTPAGNQFYVKNEALALAVSAEWDAQEKVIAQNSMHLTALCSTVLDNPQNLNKIDIVNYLINFLLTDTLLFQSQEDNILYNMQKEKWDPIIQWFCDRYEVNLKKTQSIDPPIIEENTKTNLIKHFCSYNFNALNGFIFGVDTLKSIMLTLAAVEKFITPEKAVYLARLEEEYQTNYWGRVEWSHDLNQQELQSRFSAALLFIHFNSLSFETKKKIDL